MAKTLNIIETAYRATLEEQDDTILWMTAAMKAGGADVHVLLRGNAVNYAVKTQDSSGLTFGPRRQTQPPQLAADVARLAEKGADVWIVDEDVAERGIERADLVAGLKPVSRSGLPKLLSQYDRVWCW